MSVKSKLREPLAGDVALTDITNALVREGALYEKLDNNRVHCYACAHHCKIGDGARGICQVRFNVGGKLFVPHGYAAALQNDPIEKKPFFHVLPSADALTLGMLGCDLHCSYCFTGDTRVATSEGILPLSQIFTLGATVEARNDAEIAYPKHLKAITASGNWRAVQKVFRHSYTGPVTVIRPYYLPELRCTPDHRVFATIDPQRAPKPISARELTTKHYLAIPKHLAFSSSQIVDARALLEPIQATFRVPHEFDAATVQQIMDASAQGATSRELSARFGRRADALRHLRSKVRRGLWRYERVEGIVLEGDTVRFWKEKGGGIPAAIALDESFARLLGYYCAEGSVSKDRNRPNSSELVFAFGLSETHLVHDTLRLLNAIFHIKGRVVTRKTTQAVTVSKTSLALVFQGLGGAKASGKRVPKQLYNAPRHVVENFLDAYIRGDGHRYPNGKVSVTTISAEMAFGVAFLALKVGYLPSVYQNTLPQEKIIQGRTVRQAAQQFTVVWYTNDLVPRHARESEDYYLIPLRGIAFEDFDGAVYNMQVEEDHNYLANFFLVKNCQNWDISQALRDPESGRPPTRVSAEQVVARAIKSGARAIVSSYNEPLITSEWAVEIFKLAKPRGLLCAYVSNGNATREVLEYLRPYVAAYKIDLKTMRDKNYRALGAPLQNILDGIQMAHALGFWVEIVTLVIPGFNDSNEELMDAARFIRSVSPDIPWHVTAFHADYKMLDHRNTNAATLIRAAEIGQEAGLHYVYSGNLPGRTQSYENTYCPKCNALLIERMGFLVADYRLTDVGACPKCGEKIAGIWHTSRDDVRVGDPRAWWTRAPRAV